MTSTVNHIELDGRMSFAGSTDRDHTNRVMSFHNAVANTMYEEKLGMECAVAIRKWYLKQNCLHPEDSAPMGNDWSGGYSWSDFADQTDGQGGDVDCLARGEFAQKMICRVLADAIKFNPALVDLIAEFSDRDGADQIEYLLEMALWAPHKEIN